MDSKSRLGHGYFHRRHFLALVFQFKNAVKLLLVFAAIPYGMVVSHIIVLFEFIEERHALGEPFREAMLDSGMLRLRPVLITVGATVIALFPSAYRGGPLWEPMCYTQIGGLLLATIITKVLVPVLYAIFVLDLKILKWETKMPADVDHISHDGGSGDGAPARPPPHCRRRPRRRFSEGRSSKEKVSSRLIMKYEYLRALPTR
jgi:hypothetical protein